MQKKQSPQVFLGQICFLNSYYLFNKPSIFKFKKREKRFFSYHENENNHEVKYMKKHDKKTANKYENLKLEDMIFIKKLGAG